MFFAFGSRAKGEHFLLGGNVMKCFGCNKDIDANDYCICTKCRKKMCPNCARQNSFVCSECGGDVAYLS